MQVESVLIETSWNVKVINSVNDLKAFAVLIETSWNVKTEVCFRNTFLLWY